MGLYKGDCERLRILCREHLLSSSRSKEVESGLRCRLLVHFPLFVEYSENRPAIKKRAKIEKDQSILENYDLAFYKKCSAAYSFLTPTRSIYTMKRNCGALSPTISETCSGSLQNAKGV